MLIFEIKDNNGNTTHKFSMDINGLKQGETKEIVFKTISRIIDAYDYEFTYVASDEMDG